MPDQGEFYKVFNREFIQEQVSNNQFNNQMIRAGECAKKLEDFLDSVDKVEPEYRKMVDAQCCIIIMKYMQKHGWI